MFDRGVLHIIGKVVLRIIVFLGKLVLCLELGAIAMIAVEGLPLTQRLLQEMSLKYYSPTDQKLLEWAHSAEDGKIVVGIDRRCEKKRKVITVLFNDMTITDDVVKERLMTSRAPIIILRNVNITVRGISLLFENPHIEEISFETSTDEERKGRTFYCSPALNNFWKEYIEDRSGNPDENFRELFLTDPILQGFENPPIARFLFDISYDEKRKESVFCYSPKPNNFWKQYIIERAETTDKKFKVIFPTLQGKTSPEYAKVGTEQ